MDSDNADAIARLIDKDQIIDLVHEYSYFVDHGLYDDVVELFTEDCLVDYGHRAPGAFSGQSPADVRTPWSGICRHQPPQRERLGEV